MKQELTKINNEVYSITIDNLNRLTYFIAQSLVFEDTSNAKKVTKISVNGYDIHSINFNTETNTIRIGKPAPIKSSTNVDLKVHGNFLSNSKLDIYYNLLDDISECDFSHGIGKDINDNPFKINSF